MTSAPKPSHGVITDLATGEQSVWVPCIADGGKYPDWKALVKISDLRKALEQLVPSLSAETDFEALAKEKYPAIPLREREEAEAVNDDLRATIGLGCAQVDKLTSELNEASNRVKKAEAELAEAKRMLAEAFKVIDAARWFTEIHPGSYPILDDAFAEYDKPAARQETK